MDCKTSTLFSRTECGGRVGFDCGLAIEQPGGLFSQASVDMCRRGFTTLADHRMPDKPTRLSPYHLHPDGR
jgi:hypothetical protein